MATILNVTMTRRHFGLLIVFICGLVQYHSEISLLNSNRAWFMFLSLHRNIADSLKASIAAGLRHSRNQAEKTYNRRTANERQEQAVCLVREYAEESLGNRPSDWLGWLCNQQANKPGWFRLTQTLKEIHRSIRGEDWSRTLIGTKLTSCSLESFIMLARSFQFLLYLLPFY